MTAQVLMIPPGIGAGDVVTGRAPRSRDWRAMSDLFNHVLGRGGTVVTAFSPYNGTQILPGGSETYNIAFRPRYQPTDRMWLLKLIAGGSDGIVSGVFTDFSGVTHTFAFTTPATGRLEYRSPTFLFRESITTRLRAQTQGTIKIDIDTGWSAAVVDFIACVDIPRLAIELGVTSSEYGVDPYSLTARAGIYDANGAGLSVSELARRLGSVATGTMWAESPRGCLFQWSVDTGNAWSHNGLSYLNMFGHDPPCVARMRYDGATSRAIDARVYARAITQDGTVRVSSAQAGDSATQTWTAGAGWSWKTFAVNFEVEDLTDILGNQAAGTWEAAQVEAKTDVAGGTLEVAGVWVGEDV